MSPADIKHDVQPGAAPEGVVSSAGDTQARNAPPAASSAQDDEQERAQFKPALAALQQTYALIKIGGKVWTHDQQGAVALGQLGTAQKLVFYNRSDVTLLMARTLRKEYPAANASKVLKAFFVDPNTVCHNGLEFNPRGTTPGFLNLWVGPTVTPKAGDWPLIQAFLLEVICAGNQAYYDYLIAYIAHALQRPWEKPGITIILMGGQGIGKGTLGRILRSIWQSTYLHVYKTANVTGSFNADLERTFIVFLDEALFAGDRASSDALKSLVTEEVIHINEKHQPSRQIKSYHRFVIATNAEHVKHTDRDDRRDFVLKVADSHKGDTAYWNGLDAEMSRGGIAAMVHDLLALDLTNFNIRQKPETQQLVEQKLHSLGPIARWWFDTLDSGDLAGEGQWPDFIKTSAIITGVVELAGNRLYKKPAAIDVLREMVQLCPGATKHQLGSRSGRNRGLKLPCLEQARQEFERYIGGRVEWSRYDEGRDLSGDVLDV
jgi:hypothetical protein